MSDCAVCDGSLEPLVVTVTGSWAGIDRVRYGETDFFVHGAVCHKALATTWWLAPAKACGE
jgi:hypothetical protein